MCICACACFYILYIQYKCTYVYIIHIMYIVLFVSYTNVCCRRRRRRRWGGRRAGNAERYCVSRPTRRRLTVALLRRVAANPGRPADLFPPPFSPTENSYIFPRATATVVGFLPSDFYYICPHIRFLSAPCIPPTRCFEGLRQVAVYNHNNHNHNNNYYYYNNNI